MLLISAAHAGPADYVLSPVVIEGERELDFKAGTQTKRDEDRLTAASLGFGYGATNFWFTEFYAKYQRSDSKTRFDAFEWENRFQFTETGKYPVDLGFVVEVERPRDRAEGWEFTWGPLLRAEFDHVELIANLLWQRNIKAEEPTDTSLGYRAQAKYRWRSEFDVGVQAFGDLGPWRDWNTGAAQSHKIGPAVFGRVRLGGRQALVWNAAYLFGTTNASPKQTLRAQVEYEF